MAANPQPPVFVDDRDEDNEDDAISLTSTRPDADDDSEYEVDAILAERPHEEPERQKAGEKQYLIKWKNYPYESCTWEPRGNITSPLLLTNWEEEKEEIDAGRRIAFDMRIYKNAVLKARREPDASYAKQNDSGGSNSGLSERGSESDDAMEVTNDSGTPANFRRHRQPGITPARPKLNSKFDPDRSLKTTPAQPAKPKSTLATAYTGTSRKSGLPDQGLPRPNPGASKPVMRQNMVTQKYDSTKRLTATRSSQTVKPISSKQVTPMKVHKPRKGLMDAMMDPTNQSQPFVKTMRGRNILRKKGQEMNDTAPPHLSLIPGAFLMYNDLPTKVQSTGQSEESELASSSAGRKAQKSVHFSDTKELTDDPMQIDGLAEADVDTRCDKPSAKRVSLADYQNRTTQSVAKTASFGTEGSQQLRVKFGGIMRPHGDQPWFSDFLNDAVLQFRSVCTFENFMTQFPLPERLAHGPLEAADDRQHVAITTIAHNLHRSLSGLHIKRPGYSILVYPTQCDAWGGLEPTHSGHGSSGSTAVSLRYLIYMSELHPKLYTQPSPTRTQQNCSDPMPTAVLKLSMNYLLGIDYRILHPPIEKKDHRQIYYLAFPTSHEILGRAICLWLRSEDPSCRIFMSDEEGTWYRFLKETMSPERSTGAVILHDSISRNIRRIPQLWNVLENGAHNFWSLSSLGGDTLPGDTTAEDLFNGRKMDDLPVRLGLTLLFPYGRAFLITPSFAISEPSRLCAFLEWFKANTDTSKEPCILVGCANLPEYLRELAIENSQEPPISRRKSEDRYRAWRLMHDIVRIAHRGSSPDDPPEEPPEDIRKTVWAIDMVDPNDEQSLVNWFAWWTTTKINYYRKFYVLGSLGFESSTLSHKKVRIPNYVRDTVNDPDTAHARIDEGLLKDEERLRGEETREDGSFHTPQGLSLPQGEKTSVEAAPQAATSYAPLVFESQLFKAPRDLKDFLKGLTNKKPWFVRAYDAPVSYCDTSMADAAGDHFASNFETFRDWFGPAGTPTPSRNTWMGLFWTTDQDWEEGSEFTEACHPWIALYRPVNAFRSPYAAMELLIWDYSASTTMPEPTWDALLPMQRRLIKFVHDEVASRQGVYYLEQVIVGGYEIPPGAAGGSPIDVTAWKMKDFMDDPRQWLPPHRTMFSDAGFKLLDDQGTRRALGKASALSLAQPTEFLRAPTDEGAPSRIIYHPARRTGLAQFRGKSPCTNRLFQAAFDARLKDPSCTSMDYEYEPTLSWYHDLSSEGRAYGHITVDSCNKIFSTVGIPTP